MINQHLLIRKLANFPTSNFTLLWFKSYFEIHKKCVRVGSELAESFYVSSSVGQGLILGPILFLVFFNDSDESIGSSSVLNFADDEKIARVVNNVNDSIELQKSIDNFMLWCDVNGLAVNESKCTIRVIIFC